MRATAESTGALCVEEVVAVTGTRATQIKGVIGTHTANEGVAVVVVVFIDGTGESFFSQLLLLTDIEG